MASPYELAACGAPLCRLIPGRSCPSVGAHAGKKWTGSQILYLQTRSESRSLARPVRPRCPMKLPTNCPGTDGKRFFRPLSPSRH